MNIRPFEWRDFPLLYKYRNQGVFLDSSRALIHGPSLIPLGALLTVIGPATRIYTYRCESCSVSGKLIIGQATYTIGSSFARLSYLAPENAMEMSSIAELSDYIAVQIGKQGAFHILADVDESSQVYQLLRQTGFAIYARQRIWRLDGQATGEPEASPWRTCRSSDTNGVRSLYCNVVPGLVQQVEPLPKKDLKGFVHYQNGEINAYVELIYGRHGIWVQPYIHPDVENFDRQLIHLLNNLPSRRNRPLYICIRSFQSWLETAVEAIGAHPGPQQAVMVRHLSVSSRVKQAYPLPAINGKHVEPTVSITQFEESHYLELPEIEKPI